VPTLHWLCSEGNGSSLAHYVLTAALAERLRRVFPTPAPERDPQGSWTIVSATSPTAGLLHLLGPVAEGWALRLWPILTPELLDDHGQATPLYRTKQEERPAPDLAAHERRFRLDKRDPAHIAELLRKLLEPGVLQPGDAVYIESTAGLRPIQTALMLAAPLLRELQPALAFAATGYAELGGQSAQLTEVSPWGAAPYAPKPPEKGEFAVSPFFDLTDLLDLPPWAAAATAARERLDLHALRRLIEGRGGPASGWAAPVQRLQEAVDLGWPDHLVDPLRQLGAELPRDGAPKAGGAPGTAAEATLRHVLRQVLDPLISAAEPVPADDGEAPGRERMQFQVDVCEQLVAAGRYGDAARILREVLVSRMALAAKLRRPAAEQRLHRTRGALQDLWAELSKLRNAVAHANQGRAPTEDDLNTIRGAFAAEPSLIARVRTLLADATAWAEAAVEPRGEISWVLVEWAPSAGAPPAVEPRVLDAVHASIERVEAMLAIGEAPKAKDWALSGASTVGIVVPRLRVGKGPKDIPGKEWAGRALRAAGKPDRIDPFSFSHAVLAGDLPGPVLAHLSRALEAKDVLVWRLDPGAKPALHPLFDRGVLDWARGVAPDQPDKGPPRGGP
jgi:hypothetical protein